MNCVKCDGQLRKVVIGEIEVDKCDRCSGIWFDLGELEKILEQKHIEALRNEIDNNEGHDEKQGKCPRCGGTGNMVRVTSLKDADVHIDTCSVCYGQWLDGGEIEHLKDQGILDRIRRRFR